MTGNQNELELGQSFVWPTCQPLDIRVVVVVTWAKRELFDEPDPSFEKDFQTWKMRQFKQMLGSEIPFPI